MNIAYLHIDHWPPNEGSAIQSWEIFSRLAKRHTLLTPFSCPFPEAVHAYRHIGDTRRFLDSADAVFIIVDGHFYWSEEKFSILSRVLMGKKPVVWLLNAPIEESLLSPDYPRFRFPYDRAMRRWMSSGVDICLSVSNILNAYAKKELNAHEYRVVENGADPSSVPEKKKKRDRKKPFTVLWAGSGQYPWQAMDVIARVAEQLYVKDPSIVVQIASDVSWHRLPALPSLRLMGRQPYDRIKKVVSEADMALCLYHSMLPMGLYNSPMKLFEAMGAGLPVVASDIGQIREVITHRKNGLLTTNEPDDIVSLILYLKNHPAFAHRLGMNARNTIRTRYTWDRMVNEIESVLVRLVQAKKER